jgi:DNA-binding IclR family transcriptional regulator
MKSAPPQQGLSASAAGKRAGMDNVSIPAQRETGGATGGAKALVKGLALVDVVATRDGAVRLGDLVEASGLPRPTVLRLLDVLLEQRLLQPAADGAFGLGPRLAVWGQRYLDGLDVRVHAEDLMRGLAEQTRETCFLGLRDDRMVLYIAKADSPQAVRPAARIGTRNPLHCTGIGKALLAFAPPEAVFAYADRTLEAKTPNTIVDPARLAAEMETIRARGYAIDNVENEDGVRCVAAPIRDHAGEVVAALSVSAPAYRFALEDLPALAPDVLAAAREISSRIGYREPESTTRGRA